MGSAEHVSLKFSSVSVARPRSRSRWRSRKPEASLLALGIVCVPLSIAITECFLAAAFVLRAASVIRTRTARVPRVFWLWCGWEVLQLAAWLHSPDRRAGLGELRHQLLIAALFFLVPSIESLKDRAKVWRGIFFTATVNSLVLIGYFVWRLRFHPAGVDPVVYLRSGGLLHHWAVFSAVEILVFSGLIQRWHFYREARIRLLPMLVINAAAILLSLTRMLWVSCLFVLAIYLIWNRSRFWNRSGWTWALLFAPLFLFWISPSAVRSRVIDSSDPSYYSNAERIQMLKVGWRMVRAHPIFGVGPGRVEGLYPSYLFPSENLPAYHGHLHNNVMQLAAESGILVLAGGVIFVAGLFRELLMAWRTARQREQMFLCGAALLGLAGFLSSGMFDYNYGHSLGLILLSYTVLAPIAPAARRDRCTSLPASSIISGPT